MTILQSLALAWRAVLDNRLRSALTTLGVTIGIGSVIVLVTLGTSLEASLLDEVGDREALSITLAIAPEGPGPPFDFTGTSVFTEHDIGELAALQGVDRVAPQGTVSIASLEHRGQRVALNQLVATSATAPALEPIEDGRRFEDGADEAVLDAAAAALFPDDVEVGDTLTVRFDDGEEATLEVVGILGEADRFAGGVPLGAAVYVSAERFYTTTAESRAAREEQRVYPQATVVARTIDEVEAVERRAERYLDDASDARELKPGGFEFALISQRQIVAQLQEILATVTLFVTAIAFISLVVGSIGIANIMLVSVTERTREIGIMKAIGGQNAAILKLFLMEATILGVFGALLGTVLGVVGGFFGARYLEFSFVLPWGWMAIAIVIGIVVGLLAGLYPAYRAARLHPIDALRHE